MDLFNLLDIIVLYCNESELKRASSGDTAFIEGLLRKYGIPTFVAKPAYCAPKPAPNKVKAETKSPVHSVKFAKKATVAPNRLPDVVGFNKDRGTTSLVWYKGLEKSVTFRAKVMEGDEYNRRIGFLEAWFKATCGMSKKEANEYLNRLTEQ
jgi:hypothetical protein